MKSYYRAFAAILLVSFVFVMMGCEETTSGGSGVIDVGRGEPKIIDSVMAIDVRNDRPQDITDSFDSELDDKVFLWILWGNINKTHQVEVSWISPGKDLDDPYHVEKRTFSSTTGDKITWFFIDAPTGGLSGERFASGYWIVEVALDGIFERSHLFYME